MNCPYETEDVRSRIIVENDLAFAFPTNIPIVEGHVLISPKRHVAYYEKLTKAEREAVEDLRARLKEALIKVYKAEGFNYAWNENEVGGQSIPHFHLHMLPRKKGDTGVHNYDPRKFLYRPRPRTVTTPPAELDSIVKTIQAGL